MYQATWQTTINSSIWLPIRGPNNTMKKSWYSDQTRKEFNKGTSIEDIKVKLPRS